MKISTLLAFTSSLLAPILAQDIPDEINLSDPGQNAEGEYIDPDQLSNQLKYLIDYNIIDQPKDQALELYNGDEITLNYTFANYEDYEISVVGVGGQFLDPYTGVTRANITDARLGPLVISPGSEVYFQQRIEINMPPGTFVLVPGLYILKETALALIGTKSTLTTIADRPISLFNPQFLVLELLFLGLVGAAGYLGYDYFNKSDSASTKISKKQAKLNNVAKSTAVNSEWLPENLKKINKRKA